jgi:hypothetical protein
MEIFRKAQGNVDEWLPDLTEDEVKECLITGQESELKIASPSSNSYSLHSPSVVEMMATMSSRLRYGSVDEIGFYKEDAAFEWLHIDLSLQSGANAAAQSIAAAFDLSGSRNIEAEHLEAKAFAKLLVEAIITPGYL